MMPRPNAEAMEGGYIGHSNYGRQPPQQGGRGGGGNGNPTNAMGGGSGGGMPPQGYDNDMRPAARYTMGPPPGGMQHHHGMGPPGMDPGMGGMGGFHHRGGIGPHHGHHDGMGGPGGMMPMPHGNFPGYPPQDMSPNMPRMTAGVMYGMQQQPPQPQQPQQTNSPSSFPNTAGGSGGRGGGAGGGGSDNQSVSGMAEMGPNSERGGAGGSGQPGMPGGASGPNAAGGASGNVSQADREEELLLNLLIARRQRGRMSGDQGHYADELMRLRQGRAAAAAAAAGQPGNRGGGGTLPPMPGMPPLYMDHPANGLPSVSGHHMNVGTAGHTGGAYGDHPAFKTSSDVAMNLPIQDGADQRIDRSPPHLMDARSQDMMMMRDFSGRGIKRNPYEMAAGPPMHQPGMAPMKYHMGMPGMDMTGAGAGGPPAKKKRSHKKKPADMPRRPLSAYNLFFSEERERILKEIDGGKSEEGEDKKEEAKAEEEESTDAAAEGGDEDESAKPKALLRPLIPNQKKRRPHRKTHGKISFQQLARMVGERWKALPDERRKKYQELAQEDMKRQKQAMEEYYAKQQALKEGRKPHEMGQMPQQPTDMYVKAQPMEAQQVSEGIPESSTTNV